MSFLKIKDPAERERVVKEFLEIKINIRANELAEKTGKIELREDLSELFKPITEVQKTTAREITEGLRPIKEGIEQLPRRLPRTKKPLQFFIEEKYPSTPPPTYSSPKPTTSKEEISGVFPGSDIDFGIYEKGGEFFIGDKEVYLTKDRKKLFIGKKDYILTEGLWELLTSKEPDSKEIKITSNDISMYNKILKDSNTLYVNNDPKTKKLKSENDPKVMKTSKWDVLIEPAWKEIRESKGKGKKTGKGLKKVVIPGNPNALLERLDLLMASKAAGHTGLRNELVSVCDELKRQGFFDNKSYKRIMSLL